MRPMMDLFQPFMLNQWIVSATTAAAADKGNTQGGDAPTSGIDNNDATASSPLPQATQAAVSDTSAATSQSNDNNPKYQKIKVTNTVRLEDKIYITVVLCTLVPTGAIRNPPTFRNPRKNVIVPIGHAPPQ